MAKCSILLWSPRDYKGFRESRAGYAVSPEKSTICLDENAIKSAFDHEEVK